MEAPAVLAALGSAFVNELRVQHQSLQTSVVAALGQSSGDLAVIVRVCAELDRYQARFTTLRTLLSAEEGRTIEANLAGFRSELHITRQRAVEQAQQAEEEPPLVYYVQGPTGRPLTMIDRDWLEDAYPHSSTAAIARYLGVGRHIVRRNLLDYGIAEPGENPFIRVPVEAFNAAAMSLGWRRHEPAQQVYNDGPYYDDEYDDASEFSDEEGWDEQDARPDARSQGVRYVFIRNPSHTASAPSISDAELDQEVLQILIHFPNMRIGLVDGGLRSRGIHVARRRLQDSMRRVDSAHRYYGELGYPAYRY